jgi:2-methylcitrate dehydratase PrpD
VRVEVDPELDKAYFEKDQLSARVEITTGRGKFQRFVDVPTGDPRNPLTAEEIEAKFRNQAAYVLEEAEIDRVIEKIYDFENLETVSDLMSSLAG